MSPTPEQIAKLPKWAQDYIAILERRMVFWYERAMEGSVADSNVVYRRDAGASEYGLPRDTRIKFKLAGDAGGKEYIEVGFGTGWGNKPLRSEIEVRAGYGTFVIVSSILNGICVGVRA